MCECDFLYVKAAHMYIEVICVIVLIDGAIDGFIDGDTWSLV